jgi:hypothetical protein
MKKNMGMADRIIRVIVAVVLVALYYNGTISGTLGIVLIVLAIVFVLTSLVSFCPLYLPFGLSTRGKTAEEPTSKPTDIK